MNTPVKIGIVGCGNIADNHYQAYAQIPGVDIVGVCDVDLQRAQQFASARNITTAVGTIAELIDVGVDAVSVCTPHPTHESVVVEAAQTGVHILCEKPLAIDTAAGERMVAAAERGGVTLATVFQRRYWKGARALRETIDKGKLGVPMLAHCQVLLQRDADYYNAAAWRGTWSADGGGVLMTQAIHNVDLLQWFMGDPVEVSAKAGTFVYGDLIEVEDTAAALITFDSGAIATLTATVAAKPNLGTSLIVTGTNGSTVQLSEYPEGSDAVNDIWAIAGEEQVSGAFDDGLVPAVPVSEVNERLMPLHRLQIEDFVQAVRTGQSPAVTGREAMKSVQIVEAVYESARTGQPVRLTPAGTVARELAHLDMLAEAGR